MAAENCGDAAWMKGTAMSFLDNLRDRFQNRGGGDDYYDDQDYDDYYDDEVEQEEEPERVGLLGNSRRPEPESVSVYTRSGRPVSSAPQQTTPSYGDYRNESRSSYGSRSMRGRDEYEQEDQEPLSSRMGRENSAASARLASGDTGSRTIPRSSSSQLPPYVLKPVAYDDVQMVVRRVRTNQPVVLVLRNTNFEVAKRILDFCFGLSMGVGGAVQELGDRVFVVLPAEVELSQADIDKLVADGDLER